jgi:membrane-associated phospholipid phosphatase
MGVAGSQDKRVLLSVSSLLAVGSALALVAVALLTLRRDGAHGLDQRLLYDLIVHDRGSVHSLSERLRRLGEPLPQIVLAAVAVGIGMRRGMVERALAAAAVMVGAGLTAKLLKHFLVDGRYGPVASLYPVDDHTFPSGHATAMTALTFAFCLVVPRRLQVATALLGAALTFAVATAMVVLHRHWPSDAVGGVLVGCIWGFGAIAVLSLRR